MNDKPECVRTAWNMICPSCKADDSLHITANVSVRLCADGTDADGSHEWTSDSAATCAACNWTGTVKDAEAACADFDPKAQIITPEMIASVEVYVEIYPMVREAESDRLTKDAQESPDFYDVWLRPDDWETTASASYGEWENLTHAEATAKVAELELQYPGITVSWVHS